MNSNAPHKVLIAMRIKTHELLPTGECAVPAVDDGGDVIIQFTALNKAMALAKKAELMEYLKSWR